MTKGTNSSSFAIELGVVEVRDLVVRGIHGLLPSERLTPQDFSISLKMRLSIQDAALYDDISGTVDYSLAATIVEEIVQGMSFDLVERLGYVIALTLMERFDTILSIWVLVKKLRPPMPSDLAYVGVEVTLNRNGESD
ncbi:dihydroneopterin aldolase [Acidithrix ferrooxidans]|uniref:7,8-dihydroneopterin aldolase n=1 Tax=Acidithrix ferrooxidans TaxID=1280514 RepID=A0A0D8HLK8_9ACTN|nr:dihydroneopterin aldolase [Acidithrix ferrooxidans]KJF17971.1 dihydroneopterin aldolase [Acidithrix ferrooxidans]